MGVFADVPLIVDTSALAAWKQLPATVQADFASAGRAGELRISPIVKLEFLHDAFDVQAFDVRQHRLSALDEVPLERSDGTAAVAAMAALAHLAPLMQGWHKVAAADALIAASAIRAGCGVLHYDKHYERLADVMALPHVWIVPRGTLQASLAAGGT